MHGDAASGTDVACRFHRVNAVNGTLWKTLGRTLDQTVRFARPYAQKSSTDAIELLVLQAFLINHPRWLASASSPGIGSWIPIWRWAEGERSRGDGAARVSGFPRWDAAGAPQRRQHRGEHSLGSAPMIGDVGRLRVVALGARSRERVRGCAQGRDRRGSAGSARCQCPSQGPARERQRPARTPPAAGRARPLVGARGSAAAPRGASEVPQGPPTPLCFELTPPEMDH
jgi:hypothetical protein